jgi:hydroxymethylbilane synthase
MKPITIGSRGSALALWQAQWTKSRLEALGHTVTIEIISTMGDRIEGSLAAAGGTKALFVKEIEEALLAGRVDVAVHSLKDMPAEIPEGLVIAAIPEREDPRDVLIGRADAGARVGTSSLRRAAQLRARFPGVEVAPLRGNLDTRVRRLDEGKWDGIVVAAAGVHRLGMAGRITRYLEVNEMCPAIGQGALAIQVRAGDGAVERAVERAVESAVNSLDHALTRAAVTAERVVMRVLGGGCRLPVGAHAWLVNGELGMVALVASPDGQRIVEASGLGGTPEELGQRVAAELLKQGAAKILEEVAS